MKAGVLHVFENSGQSCNAPTRMLVPANRLAEVEAIAKKTAQAVTVGDPTSQEIEVGPVVSKIQFDRVEDFIAKGIAEGAKVVKPVEDKFYGDRMGTIEDPFGHQWHVGTHKEDVPPDEMKRRAAAMAKSS